MISYFFLNTKAPRYKNTFIKSDISTHIIHNKMLVFETARCHILKYHQNQIAIPFQKLSKFVFLSLPLNLFFFLHYFELKNLKTFIKANSYFTLYLCSLKSLNSCSFSSLQSQPLKITKKSLFLE